MWCRFPEDSALFVWFCSISDLLLGLLGLAEMPSSDPTPFPAAMLASPTGGDPRGEPEKRSEEVRIWKRRQR